MYIKFQASHSVHIRITSNEETPIYSFLHIESSWIGKKDNSFLRFPHSQILCFNSGNEVGDLCNEDFDGDSFPDNVDSCPHIYNIHKTSFRDHFIVWLDGKDTADDVWKISNEVNV